MGVQQLDADPQLRRPVPVPQDPDDRFQDFFALLPPAVRLRLAVELLSAGVPQGRHVHHLLRQRPQRLQNLRSVQPEVRHPPAGAGQLGRRPYIRHPLLLQLHRDGSLLRASLLRQRLHDPVQHGHLPEGISGGEVRQCGEDRRPCEVLQDAAVPAAPFVQQVRDSVHALRRRNLQPSHVCAFRHADHFSLDDSGLRHPLSVIPRL